MSFRLPKSNKDARQGATALELADNCFTNRPQSHSQQQLPMYAIVSGSDDPVAAFPVVSPLGGSGRRRSQTCTNTNAHRSYGGGGGEPPDILHGIKFAQSDYSDEPSISSSRTNSVMGEAATAALPPSPSSTTGRQSFIIKHLCKNSTSNQSGGHHIAVVRGHQSGGDSGGGPIINHSWVPLDSINTLNNKKNVRVPQTDVKTASSMSTCTTPRVTSFRIRRVGGVGVGGQQPFGLGLETKRMEGSDEVVTVSGNAAEGSVSVLETRERGPLPPLDLIVLDSRRQNQEGNDLPQCPLGKGDVVGEGTTIKSQGGPSSITQTRSPTPTVPHCENQFTATHRHDHEHIGGAVVVGVREEEEEEEELDVPFAAPSSISSANRSDELLVVESDLLLRAPAPTTGTEGWTNEDEVRKGLPQEEEDRAQVGLEKKYTEDAVVEEEKTTCRQTKAEREAERIPIESKGPVENNINQRSQKEGNVLLEAKSSDDSQLKGEAAVKHFLESKASASDTSSTSRVAHVIGRALSAEGIDDHLHYHYHREEKACKQSEEKEKEAKTREEDIIQGDDAAAGSAGLFVVDLAANSQRNVTSLSCTPSCENSFWGPVPLSRRSSTFLVPQQIVGFGDTPAGGHGVDNNNKHESGINTHAVIAGGSTQEAALDGYQEDSSPLAIFTFSFADVKTKGAVADSNANLSKEYEEDASDGRQGVSKDRDEEVLKEEEEGRVTAVSALANASDSSASFAMADNTTPFSSTSPRTEEEWTSLAEASKKYYASRGGASRVRLEWGRVAEEAKYLADEPPSNKLRAEKQHGAMHKLGQEKIDAQSPSKLLLFSSPPPQHGKHDLVRLEVRRQYPSSAKKALPSPSSALTPRAIDSSFLLRSTVPRDFSTTTGPPSLSRRQPHRGAKHGEKPTTAFAAVTVHNPLSATTPTGAGTSATPEGAELVSSRAYDDVMRCGGFEGRGEVIDGLSHSPHFLKSVRKRLNQADHVSPRNRTTSAVRTSDDAATKNTPRLDHGLLHVRSAGSYSVNSTSTSTALIDVYSPIISRHVAGGVGVEVGSPAVRDGSDLNEAQEKDDGKKSKKRTRPLLEDKGHLFMADRKQTVAAAAVTIQRYVRGWLARGWLWLWLHANATRAADDTVSDWKARMSCVEDSSGKKNTSNDHFGAFLHQARGTGNSSSPITSACVGSRSDCHDFWTRDEELMRRIRREDREAVKRDREVAKIRAATAHRKALLDAHQSKESKPRGAEERYAETAGILRRAREGARSELNRRAITDLAERRSPAGKEAARNLWLDAHRRNTAARWSREGWQPADGLRLEEGKGEF